MVGGGGEGKISKLARVVLGNRSGKVQVLQEWHKKLAKSPQFFKFLLLMNIKLAGRRFLQNCQPY